MMKHIALTSLAAAAIFSTAAIATAPLTPAAAQVSITFGSPPPPPVYEAVPVPRVSLPDASTTTAWASGSRSVNLAVPL